MEDWGCWNEKKVRDGYAALTRRLIAGKITITAMESATAGQIASLITDTEGSSEIFRGSFVTYSNEMKIRQGVPEETIRTFGVYSVQTATAMAQAARKACPADIAVGVTGTMGNADPENADSVPGQVYFAIDTESGCTAFTREIQPQASRLDYKLAVAWEILKELDTVTGC